MTDVDNELARARLLKRLYGLLDQLGIDMGETRTEMIADPRRSVPVLEHAQSARGINNRAAFAIALWRKSPPRAVALDDGTVVSFVPEVEPERGPEHEAGPPDLDALERAWALDTSALATGLLKLMAAAYARHGGLYDGLRHNAAIRDRHRTSFR